MPDTCPTCGGPRQSFYVAGYERAEAKQATRVAQLEAALREIADHPIPSHGQHFVRIAQAALEPAGRYCTCLHDAPNVRGHDSDCPLYEKGKDAE